jgi:hypothetical protein
VCIQYLLGRLERAESSVKQMGVFREDAIVLDGLTQTTNLLGHVVALAEHFV